jgi:ribosomal-protein-alanine N-acetyltransferase
VIHPWMIGEAIYLRPLEREDIDRGWLDWINDPLNTPGLWTPRPRTREDMIRYYETACQGDNVAAFAVCDRETDRFVGNARLSEIDWVHRVAYYGRLMSPEFSGKGYGSDALIQLLRYGFHKLGLNRIWSSAWVGNRISIQSNRKVGMVEEGILRQNVFKNGRFEDAVILAMIREDFDRIHGGPEAWEERDSRLRRELAAAGKIRVPAKGV